MFENHYFIAVFQSDVLKQYLYYYYYEPIRGIPAAGNDNIKIAIAGVGNCASSLLQGREYYRKKREKGGVLYPPSACFMKHPPEQYSDAEAYRMTEEFIAGNP
jgi:myo-inositol-1-phosphate synthase